MPTSARRRPQFARRGCEPCRTQHLKCDRRLPTCTECRKTSVECTRLSDIRFKLVTSAKSFRKAQIWTATQGALRFLDETPDLIEYYNHGVHRSATPSSELSGSAGQHWSLDPRLSISNLLTDNAAYTQSHKATNLYAPELETDSGAALESNVSSQVVAHIGASPALSGFRSHEILHSPVGSRESLHGRSSSLLPEEPSPQTIRSVPDGLVLNEPGLYGTSVGTPRNYASGEAGATIKPLLADLEEARLLRYYVEHLARRFDVVDPERHFRIEVPQRALTSPTLLYAILALSARHLSRLEDYDPLVSDRYHTKCLEYLIPMLNDATVIKDENLLASVIILRHLEEIEVPLAGQTPEEQESSKSHLFGTHVLMSAQEDAATAGSLRQAAFWVGLRQEIYIAFIHQHSVLPPLQHENIDRSVTPASDHVWANRVVVLCADVMRYCFGDSDTSANSFYSLEGAVAEWLQKKPSSFNPLYYSPADEQHALPHIMFLREEISLGWQHYYVAKILLAAHDPKVPRIGPRRMQMLREADEDIKEKVLLLCGICESNPAVSPNATYATMAITVAGDKFTDPREQEALLYILDLCDRQHALSTGHIVSNLKQAWGWT